MENIALYSICMVASDSAYFKKLRLITDFHWKLWHLHLREGIICAKGDKLLKVTFRLKYEQIRSLNVLLDKCT